MSRRSRLVLYPEFLPLCARMPLDYIRRAYDWAALSTHPECRYAISSIARLHACPPGSRNSARAVIMRHLGMVVKLFAEYLDGALPLPDPGLARFHCEITQAAGARTDPELQMLAYRILQARSQFDTVSYAERNALYQETTRHLAAITRSAVSRLKEPALPHSVPALDDLLSPEETVYHAALAGARDEPATSEAFVLFTKIQQRTAELHRKKTRRALERNRKNRSYYIRGSGSLPPWCRKLARLYLAAHGVAARYPAAVVHSQAPVAADRHVASH